MTNTIETKTPEERLKMFKEKYTKELAAYHATGACIWPINKLDEIVDRVMQSLLSKRMVDGVAIKNTMKAFNLKTQKELFAFLKQ